MAGKLSPSRIRADILRALLESANRTTASQAQAYFKEPIAVIGVATPKVRLIARGVHARVKSEWDVAQALALCELLLPDPRLEVKVAGLFVLERFQKRLGPDSLPIFQRWILAGWCDSWAVIDGLCSYILGPLLLRHPALAVQTMRWVDASSLWLRRAAAVSLIVAARKGKLLDEAYAVAGKLLCDPEDLVQKACGWLLKEAGKSDTRRLQGFLQEHGSRCARTTFRYAIEKFPEAVRQRLLRQKRPERPRRTK